MPFLFAELLIWLCGAALVGAVFGGSLGRGRRRLTHATQARLAEMTKAIGQHDARHHAAQVHIRNLEEALESARVERSRVLNIEAQLRVLQSNQPLSPLTPPIPAPLPQPFASPVGWQSPTG